MMKILLIAISVAFLLVAQPVFSQSPQAEACRGAGGQLVDRGKGGRECVIQGQGSRSLNDIIRSISNILVFIVGAVAVIMIIIGGFRYVVSGGDQAGIEGAKNTILYAVVGLIVAIVAYAIVNFVLRQLT